jgi:hypothetical protein
MPEPITLFSIAYKGVTVTTAVVELYSKLNPDSTGRKELANIATALQQIEGLIEMQIYQPLRAGISMLADADAEYKKNVENGRELARVALGELNKAVGAIESLHKNNDDIDNWIKNWENLILVVVGKACAYKLLDMVGAYENSARKADELLQQIIRWRKVDAKPLWSSEDSYEDYAPPIGASTLDKRNPETGWEAVGVNGDISPKP